MKTTILSLIFLILLSIKSIGITYTPSKSVVITKVTYDTSYSVPRNILYVTILKGTKAKNDKFTLSDNRTGSLLFICNYIIPSPTKDTSFVIYDFIKTTDTSIKVYAIKYMDALNSSIIYVSNKNSSILLKNYIGSETLYNVSFYYDPCNCPDGDIYLPFVKVNYYPGYGCSVISSPNYCIFQGDLNGKNFKKLVNSTKNTYHKGNWIYDENVIKGYSYMIAIEDTIGYIFSNILIIPDDITNVQSIEKSKIQVYPTLTSGLVNIKNSINNVVNVYTSEGILLFSKRNLEVIDFSNYSNGIYYLNVISENKSISTKIIKQ